MATVSQVIFEISKRTLWKQSLINKSKSFLNTSFL